MPTAAQILAERLHQAGCRYAFGIPGGEVLAVMDALAGAGIAFHLTKHENPAGFMAEGTHHVTGAPGILVATIGPGVANAVNVIANAEQDRVPLIVLTGCVDQAEAVGYTHQVFDHSALLKPVTKASFTLADGAVDGLIDKALAIASEGRPGPVHIDVPISLATREQREPRPFRPARRGTMRPDDADVAAAAALLEGAERPIMVAGLEVLAQGAETAVADFARRFQVPVITTYKAKGVLPEDEPLALGGAGLSPLADRHLLPLVEMSDLILLAGYDPIEMRHGWCHPWDPAKAEIVEFTAAPHPHGVHETSVSFAGDIGAGLAALGAAVKPAVVKPDGAWSNGAPAAAKAALDQAFRAEEDWGPAAVVDQVRKALPAEGIATVDSGAHRILLSQIWRCPRPRSLLQSSGLCTMGCALPLAMGAKLAAPERPVVAFVGDAGLEMVLGELATLRDLRLPLVIVVFVDASLALIELKQRNSGLTNLGVDFGATDFVRVAEALGGGGVEVDNRADLERAVKRGLAAETFTVVAAVIGPKAYDGRL